MFLIRGDLSFSRRPQTYDPLNRVITRNINGAVTQNVWEGWNLIEEHRPDWSLQRCYLQGANQVKWWQRSMGTCIPIIGTAWDGRGNTSHITGDNAYLLERYTYDLSGAPTFYDEWGNERWGGSVYDTRFLFAGSQYLPETGLYDMRNRFYSPALNRFLQTDPIGFAGDALNLYRYCGDDPVDRSDPMGLVADRAFGPLTSFDGGDWVRGSDGLSDWDRDHGMPSNRPAGMDGGGVDNGAGGGGKDAKGRQDTIYHSFNDAAAAQKDAAYNMMSKEHEAGTEIWQKDDGSVNYRSDKPRVTGGLYDVNDGKEKGKFLGFEPIAGRHPAGYHIAGWMYAHPFYRPEVPPHDQRRAFEKHWNVYLVTPVRADRRLQNPGARNVVTYEYPAQPTD